MTIRALHIPYDETVPVNEVAVNERNAMSYYPYVQRGPVEGGYLTIEHIDFVCYVNSRYPKLDEKLVNERASALFELAGAGMFGGAIRGDALLVLGAGGGDYERSIPQDLISIFVDSDLS